MASPLNVNSSASPAHSKPSSPIISSAPPPPPPALPASSSSTNPLSTAKALKPEDISSPHELTAFVDVLLAQLESRFDEMSAQVLDRMNQMSTRVDALESSIQDIISGDMAGSSTPQTPSASGTGLNRRGSES